MTKWVAICDDGGDQGNLGTINMYTGEIGTGVGSMFCAGDVTYVLASTQAPFDPSMVDPAVAGMMFAGGFFMLVPVWAAAAGVRFLVGMLRDDG